MEEEFYKDEFEQFLQEQANNHRMFPTDGVWLRIYNKLHGDKKWPGLTLAAFAILTATIAISIYFSPKPNIFALQPANKTIAIVEPAKKANALLNLVTTENNNTKGRNLVEKIPENLSNSTRDKQIIHAVIQDLMLASDDNQNKINSGISFDLGKQPTTKASLFDNQNAEKIQTKKVTNAAILEQEKIIGAESQEEFQDEENTLSSHTEITQATPIKKSTPTTIRNIKSDLDDQNIADNFLKQQSTDLADFTTTKINHLKNKFTYTVYLAPSISYRKLKEDQSLNGKNSNLTGPVASNYVTDVNRLVRHKPGTGIETGFAFTYHLSNTFGITSGAQFNVRQYTIEAFKSSTELTSIALLSSSGIDTLRTFAIYRNNNGDYSAELVNRYYQLSVPIGIVWEVLGNKKVQFNVAANIQPTYTFNSNSYVLSTNFKNYTANSGMLRNWTINSNIESFVSLHVGEYKWQLGPQFRYQHLPTFINNYPIREHLMDYGIKIGVSKQIK